jgi:dienelactone hydrolase
MTVTAIDYVADGVTLSGYLARPAGEAVAPGILVAHEAPGMNEHVKSRTRALAELGYIAFALDLYGETGFPREEVLKRHSHLMATPGLMFRRASAALEVLAAQPGVDRRRLAAIGFCQGGITVLELARGAAPIRCTVGFHPGLQRPAGSSDGKIGAKVLMMVGDADPVVPAADRLAFSAEMTGKAADWQLHLFGGAGHAFMNQAVDALGIPGYAYDAVVARRAWKMMQDFLDECLT